MSEDLFRAPVFGKRVAYQEFKRMVPLQYCASHISITRRANPSQLQWSSNLLSTPFGDTRGCLLQILPGKFQPPQRKPLSNPYQKRILTDAIALLSRRIFLLLGCLKLAGSQKYTEVRLPIDSIADVGVSLWLLIATAPLDSTAEEDERSTG